MLAAFGLDVCVGQDAPLRADKGGDSAPEKGVKKTPVTPNAKPVDNADTKPNANPNALKSANAPGAAKRSLDEEAIRLTGETFVKAYCDGDAKSIAAQFTPDAEFIDERGTVYQGREAIEGAMTALFAENAGCKIEMDIETIRFVSPGVAVEDGTTMFTTSDGEESVYSRYTAIHVKTDGKWLAASVRDRAPKNRRQHRTQLQQLAWLQGEWVHESSDSVVIFTCEAADGGNFLVRKFAIRIAGQDSMNGTQRIGWDPLTGKLRAWIFDSEGGYSDGFWHRDENSWVLKSSGVTSEGETASSTSIYTFVNEHTMTWQSVDHEIAGVELPDSEPITIVRRAPVPGTSDENSLTESK